jgi:RNA polymerase sigma-70 factor (ECF subfamily)
MQFEASAPDVSTLDDATLLAVIGSAYGKPGAAALLNGAVAVLYDRYSRLVYSVAYHAVGNAETAEEITQDVFVRACSHASNYRAERAGVRSWLASITRHRAFDELRRRSIRPEHALADWPEDAGSQGAIDLPLDAGPEQAVVDRAQLDSLRQVMAGLPPDQRQVLALAYFNGLSHSQIAELLSVPLGTIKSRIRLAMHKLRDHLIELGANEP